MTTDRNLPSIESMILKALQNGERITSLEAWTDFGTSRMSAVVHRLRRAGYAVMSRRITVQAKRGRKTCVSQYWMD